MKAKFSSYNQYLFGLLFSRNARETRIDQFVLWTFPFCLKKTFHKPLEVAAAKEFFPIVCIIDTTYFKECYLFHVITRRHYFFICMYISNIFYTQMFGEPTMLLCSLKQVFWNKSSFYVRYLHNDLTMLRSTTKFLLLNSVDSFF